MRLLALVLAVAVPCALALDCTNLNLGTLTALCDNHQYDFSCVFNNGTFVGADSAYSYYMQLTPGGIPPSFPYCRVVPPNTGALQVSRSDSTCYSLGNVNSQTWSISYTNGNPTININMNGGDSGRQLNIKVTCDPTAVTPLYKARGEVNPLNYEFDVYTNAACTNYIPSCHTTSFLGPSMTHCTQLGIPMPDGTIFPSYGYMLDGLYESSDNRSIVFTRTDMKSCNPNDAVLLQLSITLTVQRSGSVMSWKPSSFSVYISNDLSALTRALNSQCPCGGVFNGNQWRDISDPTKCPPLPPPKASWLCWLFVTTQFYTTYTPYRDVGYVRTMLNTSITGSHNPPADSPPLFNLPLGNVGNADACDFERWSACGDTVMSAVPNCNYAHNTYMRELCLLSSFDVNGTNNLEYCCPCLAKYSTSYGYTYANIKCQPVQ